MPCVNCERAAIQPLWPCFTASCVACTAREIAQGPHYFWSTQAHDFMPAYRRQLMSVFGQQEHEWKQGHRMVRCAAQQLRGAS